MLMEGRLPHGSDSGTIDPVVKLRPYLDKFHESAVHNLVR